MSSILRAGKKDAETISILAQKTFLESHSHSASTEDINQYILKQYSVSALKKNLAASANLYYIIYNKDEAVGYSKIVLNSPFENHKNINSTKLDRIYILENYYGKGLGKELLTFNLDLARSNGQSDIWLYTWKENHRGISFYKNIGFEIIGSHDFKISETHVNPNHLMLLSL